MPPDATALIKFYASFMKPGDKQADTLTSARSIGDAALCTGEFTFTPASKAMLPKGYWTKIAGKVGGEWKIHRDPDLQFRGASVGPRHAAGFMPCKRV